MRKFVQILLVTAILIVLSAWLAPLVYQFLPQFKFEKILNRLLMISILAACFMFIRIDRALLETCGLNKARNLLSHWMIGFLVSLTVLVGLVFLELKLGGVSVNHDRIPVAKQIVLALITGLFVGIIEEFFFRGFLFLKFKKLMGCPTALIVTNLIYSSAHFIKNGKPFISGQPVVTDSFRVIGASFQEFSKWADFWPGFVGLFLFGLVLSFAFKRSGALYVSMGIHAGAVTFLKMTNRFILPSEGASTLMFGGKGFYSGVLGWLFICLIAWLISLIFKENQCRQQINYQ